MELTTRQRILSAAGAVVRSDGAARLSLERVAAAAGVSKGGLLYHFPNKEALLAGLVESGVAEFDRAIDARAAAGGDWLAAYAEAALASGDSDVWASSLVAPLLERPALLDPLRRGMAEYYRRAEAEAGPAGQLLLLALDGLYLHQLASIETGIDPAAIVGGLLDAAAAAKEAKR